MNEQNWLELLTQGREKILHTTKRLNRLSGIFMEAGNDKISYDLASCANNLESGLNNINKAIDQHLTNGYNKAYSNLGQQLTSIIDSCEKG